MQQMLKKQKLNLTISVYFSVVDFNVFHFLKHIYSKRIKNPTY